MSDSKLVNYVRISPNRHHPRNHKIDTITIHHMAGNLTVEDCGRIFQNTKRAASSNYGIGTDGRIGLYVHEEDRAWTSGSPSNDHRAITFEVANDGGAPDWHVSDKALESLINLLVDVCKRNGIEKLVWSDNKDDRVHHRNGCNMTVHRDFQATACPGPYLYSKQGWIAQQVNKRLEDDEMGSYEQFKEYMKKYEEERAKESADSWAVPHIKWANEHGIIVGDDDGNFRPQDPIKRQEMAGVARSIMIAVSKLFEKFAE